MHPLDDPLLLKFQLIMESPTERNKYSNLNTFDEKIAFLQNHFIMKEMEVKLLERKYLLDKAGRKKLLQEIGRIIAYHQ